ncbi:MAG: tRNA lysidine(34) synthetase TilS [Candidatus Omnitrophota bacterium]
MNIKEKVKDYILREGLINKGDRVILGVSGGVDSVCLLYLLASLRQDLGFSLTIAHLDHALRKESGDDAKFVKKLALELKLPLICKRITIKRNAKRLSIEEAARNMRLEFLFRSADKTGAGKIALAHNFDDQAETVLMRIIRGTGLCGLSAMLSKRRIGRVFIIRPLLMVKRREIENFLMKEKRSFCLDKTNSSEIYFRNKIRHKLLPLLEKGYNKNIKEVLVNLAHCAGVDYDYLQKAAANYAKGSKGSLNLNMLKRLHPSMVRLKLREAISLLQGDTRRISFKHIQELEDLVSRRPQGSIVDLPKGLSALKRKKTLYFYLR